MLQVVDLIWTYIFVTSPWSFFSRSGMYGYRHPQLWVNEPNWLALCIFLLVFLTGGKPVTKTTKMISLLIFLLLGSRVFLLMGLFILYSKYWKTLALTLSAIIFLLITVDSIWVYDLSKLSRNPRLNDFLALYEYGGLSVFGDIGSVLEGSRAAIPWRPPSFILNSIFVTYLFEFGILTTSLLLLPRLILLTAIIHNFIYKPIWLFTLIVYGSRKIR